MSDEEKEAIETVKYLKNLKWYEHAFDRGTEVLTEDEKQDIDIVLNLIEKLQKENEKQEKVIDGMANKLVEHIGTCPLDLGYDDWWDKPYNECEKKCKNQMSECWKQYFYRKVEDNENRRSN